MQCYMLHNLSEASKIFGWILQIETHSCSFHIIVCSRKLDLEILLLTSAILTVCFSVLSSRDDDRHERIAVFLLTGDAVLLRLVEKVLIIEMRITNKMESNFCIQSTHMLISLLCICCVL